MSDDKLGKEIRESDSISYTESLTLEQIKTKYGDLLTEEQYKALQELSKNE